MEKLFEFAFNHWMLVTAFFALLAYALFLEGRRAGRKLSPQEVVQLLNREQAVLVDVRDRKDFREGHIRGSLHLPLSSLKERAGEIRKKNEEAQVVVVDKAGQHSGHAVKLLQSAGIEPVARLNGGISEWRASNLPLAKG